MENMLIAGAVLLAGALIAVVLVRKKAIQAGEAARMATTLQDQLSLVVQSQTALTERLQTLAEGQATSQATVMKSLDERLDKVSENMGKNLNETATKTAESLGKLNTRLGVIDEAQKNITKLSGQVVGLQDILANKQARGAFGEIQMADIVQNALPPSAYQFQATLSNGKRADCLLRLPNPPGAIVIDAKFPLEAFSALRAAESEVEKAVAARDFRTAMMKHITDIAARYIVPGETAESALMFLPAEAVYAELHASFDDVVQKSFRARVFIVSPTTLMATLNTVRAVLKDARMREHAHIIQNEVGKMAEDVKRLQKRAANLQTHFGQAGKDVSEIMTSADKIIRHTDRIEEVQLTDNTEESDDLKSLPSQDEAQEGLRLLS